MSKKQWIPNKLALYQTLKTTTKIFKENIKQKFS